MGRRSNYVERMAEYPCEEHLRNHLWFRCRSNRVAADASATALSAAGVQESGSSPGNKPPTNGAQPADIDQQVPLAAGVTISLTSQQFYKEYVDYIAITGQGDACGPEMMWVLKVENASNQPFVINLDKTSITQTDDEGNSNTLLSSCELWRGIDGALAKSTTVAPGKPAFGIIMFKTVGVSPSSTYLTIRLKLSGKDLAFRYSLR